jgi:hypothetical protein
VKAAETVREFHRLEDAVETLTGELEKLYTEAGRKKRELDEAIGNIGM